MYFRCPLFVLNFTRNMLHIYLSFCRIIRYGACRRWQNERSSFLRLNYLKMGSSLIFIVFQSGHTAVWSYCLSILYQSLLRNFSDCFSILFLLSLCLTFPLPFSKSFLSFGLEYLATVVEILLHASYDIWLFQASSSYCRQKIPYL